MSAAAWAVVIAKPAAEFIAADRLRERGYRSYCPRYKSHIKGHRQGKGEPIFRPLFPRYLFAELHPNQEANPILWASGVCNHGTLKLWGGGRPQSLLSAAFIDAMRREEDAGSFDAGRREPLKIDAVVRAVEGPFAGLLGVIVELDDDEKRVWVLLDILGGRKVRFGGDTLELVMA